MNKLGEKEMTKIELEAEVLRQELIIKELQEKNTDVLLELKKAEKQNFYNKKDLEEFAELKEKHNEIIQGAYDKEKGCDVRVQEELDKYKHLEHLLKDKTEIYDVLQKTFNSLAELFDEYIKMSEDNFETFKVFLRNNERNKEFVTNKIKNFNSNEGGNKK